MTSLNVAEAKKRLSDLLGRVADGGASVVAKTWGVLRLESRRVAEILDGEDGLFDA